MQLHNWFKDLNPRLQRLIRSNVQDWKVSALRHLKHLTDDVIEAAVTTGRKTASQLKQLSGKVHQKMAPSEVTSGDNNLSFQNKASEESEEFDLPEIVSTPELALNSVTPTPTLLLTRGVRIVVQNESTGWNGASGIITTVGNNDDFWVLLDHTIAQGMVTKHLLKSHQLRLESKISTPTASAQVLTTVDIDKIKAETIRQYLLEHAEEQQGKYLEIKGAALVAAEKEIASFEKHAQCMTDKVSKLVEQLEASEQEIARLHSLHAENQQLQQRVTELENALLKASEDSWGNTFNTQAAKVMNSEIEKKVAPLMSEVERLQNLVQKKDAQLAQMQQIPAPDSEEVISEFGEIGEQLGWHGWRRSGYRDKNGTLHKGINAISAFVSDLAREYHQETAF
ncbi:hypothetical protein CAL7716_042180 [Calothrix sp. PCC 7716]|nr:hypothetical protein CAL7716_042180 [Calothrix sp. PCC 7716]